MDMLVQHIPPSYSEWVPDGLAFDHFVVAFVVALAATGLALSVIVNQGLLIISRQKQRWSAG